MSSGILDPRPLLNIQNKWRPRMSKSSATTRNIKKSTVLKWKVGNWLEIVDSNRHKGEVWVTSVRCKLCAKYEKKLTNTRNFNFSWCRGTTNVKLDAVKTHMNGEPHKLALKLEDEEMFKAKPGPLPAYAATPLGKAFFKLNENEKVRVTKLIEIAYVVAKEEMPFAKFVAIAKLEKRHGVELGQTYLNDHACADFVDTIAEIYEEELNQVRVLLMF